MSVSLIALAVASVLGAVVSSVASMSSAAYNVQAQKDINSQNVEAQNAINSQNIEAQKEINQQNIDYSKEFAQNGIQWRMADLEAAGLNPVMAAGNSGGSGPIAMSAPTARAAQQQAPQIDLSGVSSAINALNNMMMTSYFMNERTGAYSDRTQAIYGRHNGSDARNALAVNSSKQIADVIKNPKDVLKTAGKGNWEQDWDKMMKEFKKADRAWRKNI